MRDTRAELIAEAELLVRKRGFSGFSYADLADSVGIRKASIHHHFPTKADLAEALLASFDARYKIAMAEILRDTSNALERVRAYAGLYRDGVERGLGCLCAAFAAEIGTLPDGLSAAISRFFAGHLAWLEQVLVEGVEDGSIRPVAAGPHARLIVAMLEGSLMMERLLDGAEGFAESFAVVEKSLTPIAE